MSATQKEKKKMEKLLFENWTPFLIWSGIFQIVKQRGEGKAQVILDPLIFSAFVLGVKPILMHINVDEVS